MTCAKTQGFLAKHKATVTEQADAKKATIKGAAALDVLDGADELYVARGKKVEHVDLKRAKPDCRSGADGRRLTRSHQLQLELAGALERVLHGSLDGSQGKGPRPPLLELRHEAGGAVVIIEN